MSVRETLELLDKIANGETVGDWPLFTDNTFVRITSPKLFKEDNLIQIDKTHVHVYRRTCELLGSIWKCRCGEWRIFFPRLEHDNDTPFDWDRDNKK